MRPTRQLINKSGTHTIQICLTENSQLDLVTQYIKDGLSNGEAVFVISRPRLIKMLKSKMDGPNFGSQPLQDPNQIRFFDAQILLLYLQSDEGIEETAFHENIAVPIYRARSRYKKVRTCGEIFDILWKQEQHHMVLQLADYCKNLPDTQEFSHLCTYSLDHLDLDSYGQALELICKNHAYLTPQKYGDLTGQEMDESMNAFAAAWNRVINKRTH